MKYFLIAGEPSGDVLGGKLIASIKAQDPEAEFIGIGGQQMTAAGLQCLLPMKELTVIGIWEAIMRYPQLRKIAFGIVGEVQKHKPDAVITIDFPDFNFKVAELIKKRGVDTKLIHYVAPTVWAWRPGRAKAVAKYLDAMLCLFPFEPDYFKKHGLHSDYVGHPIVEDRPSQTMGQKFRQDRGIPDTVKTVGLFFGSRDGELKNMKQIIKETAIYLEEQLSNIQFVVPTLPNLEFDVLEVLNEIESPIYVSHDHGMKWDAIEACDVAVAVSGTVALELAYGGIPHVVVYKTHPLTYILLKFLVKSKFIHLANIMLDKLVVPEFIQFQCKSEKVSAEVKKLLEDPKEAQKQVENFAKLQESLTGQNSGSPSVMAAHQILKIVKP